jgi:hypothetical protein
VKTGRKSGQKRWAGGDLDADPFHLPQSVAIEATGRVRRAFGLIRYATIDTEAVAVKDSSPILGVFDWSETMAAYRGVLMRVAPSGKTGSKTMVIVELVHSRSEKRCIAVYASEDGVDAASRWRAWGRMLRLPLLVEDREGTLHHAERRLGGLQVNAPQPHAGANPLSARRPLSFGHSGQPRLWGQRLVVGGRPLAY